MEVVKDLTCPICLEFYCHPVILPCSHVMCKEPCADQLFDGNFIRCPVCRDNSYVSGGLQSLPRVITIESIIEKVRAERKKRNATNPGHARENSFDDMFSDVTFDSKCGNEQISTPTSVVPVCNSSYIPAGNSPVSLLRSDFPDSSTSTLMGHLSRSNLLSSSEVTVSSSQVSSPRTLTDDTTGPSLDTFVSLRGTSTQQRDTEMATTYTSLFNTNLSGTHAIQDMTRLSNFNMHDSLSLSPSSTHSSYFTTHLTPFSPAVTQTDSRFLLGDILTTSHDANTLERQTDIISPSRVDPNDNISLRQSSLPISTIFSDRVRARGESGDSNYSFTTDQIQTSTPRADLRNIRLCHEQSLANLKACSDSIKALQKSRPSLRNSHNDSLYSSTPEAAHSCGSQRDVNLVSSPNQNSVCSGQIKSTSLISNQNTSDLRTHQSTSDARHTQDTLSEPAPGFTNQYGHPTERPVPMQGTHENDNQNVSMVKLSIQEHLQRLCDTQTQLLYHMNSFTEKAQTGQDLYDKGRYDINKECDSLVAEIENKRYQFLLHIDDERKKHRLEANDTTIAMQKLLASSQELSLFVEEMLESKPQTILSTAEALMDSLSSVVAECQSCLQTSEATNDETASDDYQHLIDTRLQRGFVERIDYLSVPPQPIFDVHRCTRNTSTVALVLKPPTLGDVIDHYEIFYCSNEQKELGIEERYHAQMPDADPDVYGLHGDTFPVILIENLCQSTHYFFCACAVNKKGKSAPSDYIQCKTLGDKDCVVPVPSTIETQCQVTSTSVTLTCPSLATVTSHQCVRHRLLQRSSSGAVVWKGVELTNQQEEFTVGRLRPDTLYNFVVIAYNGRGECQLSAQMALRTSTTPRLLL